MTRDELMRKRLFASEHLNHPNATVRLAAELALKNLPLPEEGFLTLSQPKEPANDYVTK